MARLTVPLPEQLTTLADGALAWAAAGWPVFPIVPRGKTPYRTGEFCGRAEAHDCGFHCASTDTNALTAWWREHPDSNIGLASADSVLVDEDRLGAIVEASLTLPSCPWELTGRAEGGRHFFYRAPEGWDGLRGNEVKVSNRIPGVELKGFGKGYVVAAPSVHATGRHYEVRRSGWVPVLPEAILARLAEVTEVAPALITLTGGAYELPTSVGIGGRYRAIVSYTAHLHNRGLAVEEMWPLVVTILAPLFTPRLSEAELRQRFENATKDMTRRLGAPRGIGAKAAPAGPLEDAPLTEYDSTPVEWLWPGWLPRGVVTIMDGDPGVSKSTLVADLVARVTTGRDWPDGTPGRRTPGRVVWVTTEDDPGRVLRPRIEAAGGDASLVRFVKSEVVFPSGASAFHELLVRRATEPLGLVLVILDPLFSHIEASVRTIADAEMRKGVMNPLSRAAEAAGVALLVVRHFSKNTQASPISRGAGSLGGIIGAARASWNVTLDPEDETGETKAVGVAKLNYARPPRPLRYRVVDRLPPGWVTGSVSGIEWLGESAVSIGTLMSDRPNIAAAVALLSEILRDGPVGAPIVEARMRAAGFGRGSVTSAARRLRVVKAKQSFTSGWTWSLPEADDAEEASQDAPEEAPLHPSAPSGPDAKKHRGAEPEPSTSSDPSAPSRIHPSPLRSDGEDGVRLGSDGPAEEAEDAEESGASRVRACAREGTETGTTIACRDYRAHQLQHVRSGAGFVCLVCQQEEDPS